MVTIFWGRGGRDYTRIILQIHPALALKYQYVVVKLEATGI